MSRKKKIIIAIVVVVVLGGIAAANLLTKRSTAITVNVEKIEKRDLESIVSASGKVQPKRKVAISAETMGKVVNLAVNEGDLVTKGQLLLQIDPRNLEMAVQNRDASLARQRSQMDQMKAQTENLRISLRQAEDNLQRAEGLHFELSLKAAG